MSEGKVTKLDKMRALEEQVLQQGLLIMIILKQGFDKDADEVLKGIFAEEENIKLLEKDLDGADLATFKRVLRQYRSQDKTEVK